MRLGAPDPHPFVRRKFHRRPAFRAGGMFARAVPVPRLIPLLIASLVAVSGCGGGESQDANEPEGTYRLEVADASFPEEQGIAEQTTMRIRVRNPAQRTVPNVAVTVETKGAKAGDGVTAFGQKSDDSRLADQNRPVWILDQEPVGGTSAYANTWTPRPAQGRRDQDLRVEAHGRRARQLLARLPGRPRPRRQGQAGRGAARPAAPSPSASSTSPSPRA